MSDVEAHTRAQEEWQRCLERTGRSPSKVVTFVTWGWGQLSDGTTFLLGPVDDLAPGSGGITIAFRGIRVEDGLVECPDCRSHELFMTRAEQWHCPDCGRNIKSVFRA